MLLSRYWLLFLATAPSQNVEVDVHVIKRDCHASIHAAVVEEMLATIPAKRLRHILTAMMRAMMMVMKIDLFNCAVETQ